MAVGSGDRPRSQHTKPIKANEPASRKRRSTTQSACRPALEPQSKDLALPVACRPATLHAAAPPRVQAKSKQRNPLNCGKRDLNVTAKSVFPVL